MVSQATQALGKIGNSSASILSAKRVLKEIFKAIGGAEQFAKMVASDMEVMTPHGRVQIYRAILNALLKIDEAEETLGEAVDEQAIAIVGQVEQAMKLVRQKPELLDLLEDE